jgi:signal peptidase II
MTSANLKERVARWSADARANPLFLKGLLGAFAITFLDQVSKALIVHVVKLPSRLQPCERHPQDLCGQISLTPIFDLTYVQNKGASFGMLAGVFGSRLLLTAISLGVSVGLIVWLARVARPLVAAGIALIVGGAIGNLIDRLLLGYVVDFLDFSGLGFPWVFNVADASINVGIGLFILDAFLERKSKAAP